MKEKPPVTGVWAIGTAVPSQRISQRQALQFMLASYPPEQRLARRLNYIYRRSQIDYRHSCCTDFAPAETNGESLYLLGDPGTAHRMQVFEEEIVALACPAIETALARQTLFERQDITHLIGVTCTGFFAPGPDQRLVEALGLRRAVHRWQIGFMGCQAALQGLQAADAICRADPRAVVLLVCAELCTLHFQRQPSEENLVANSLFADGAAAVILSNAVGKTAAPLCAIQCFSSYLAPATHEMISWRISDRGFQMGLDMAVPRALGTLLPDFIESFLPTAKRTKIHAWAIHPGGRAVLDTVQRVLGLEHRHLSASRAVLREYGNMSSPTVLFVLDRLLTEQPQTEGVALSFGPGLSIEGMRWRSQAAFG